MSDKQLAIRLKEYRTQGKLSQWEMASKLGVSTRTYEGWEQHRQPQGYARIALEQWLKKEGESK